MVRILGLGALTAGCLLAMTALPASAVIVDLDVVAEGEPVPGMTISFETLKEEPIELTQLEEVPEEPTVVDPPPEEPPVVDVPPSRPPPPPVLAVETDDGGRVIVELEDEYRDTPVIVVVHRDGVEVERREVILADYINRVTIDVPSLVPDDPPPVAVTPPPPPVAPEPPPVVDVPPAVPAMSPQFRIEVGPSWTSGVPLVPDAIRAPDDRPLVPGTDRLIGQSMRVSLGAPPSPLEAWLARPPPEIPVVTRIGPMVSLWHMDASNSRSFDVPAPAQSGFAGYDAPGTALGAPFRVLGTARSKHRETELCGGAAVQLDSLIEGLDGVTLSGGVCGALGKTARTTDFSTSGFFVPVDGFYRETMRSRVVTPFLGVAVESALTPQIALVLGGRVGPSFTRIKGTGQHRLNVGGAPFLDDFAAFRESRALFYAELEGGVRVCPEVFAGACGTAFVAHQTGRSYPEVTFNPPAGSQLRIRRLGQTTVGARLVVPFAGP